MTDTQTFLWPGELVKGPEHRAEIVRQGGEDHVSTCQVCRCMFYRAKLANVCYGCWYSGHMRQSEENYMWTIAAVHAAGGRDVWMDQTGGMCLALHIELDDDHFAWLTDKDDSLSFEPEPEQGWTIGVYKKNDDDGYGEPIAIFGEDGDLDYESREVKTPASAGELIRVALEKLEAAQ